MNQDDDEDDNDDGNNSNNNNNNNRLTELLVSGRKEAFVSSVLDFSIYYL
jgi:hypothetical protein